MTNVSRIWAPGADFDECFTKFGLLEQNLTNVSRIWAPGADFDECFTKLRLRAGAGMSCHLMSVMYMSCHVCHVHVSCHVMSVMYMFCHVMS